MTRKTASVLFTVGMLIAVASTYDGWDELVAATSPIVDIFGKLIAAGPTIDYVG